METTVSTKPLTFAAYRPDAIERETDAMDRDGMDSGVCAWMSEDIDRSDILGGFAFALSHRILVARKDDDLYEAVRKFKEGMAQWVARYVDSWEDSKRWEFIAEIEAETEESIRLDRREGNLA